MPKTIIDSRGIVTVPGRGLEIREVTVFETTSAFSGETQFSGSAEFSGSAVMRQGVANRPSTITDDSIIYRGGMYYVSSSVPVTCSLRRPNHLDVAGSEIVIRLLTAVPVVVTSSAISYPSIAGVFGSSPQEVGTKFTLPGEQHNSVILKNDGYRYIIIGGSGSFSVV